MREPRFGFKVIWYGHIIITAVYIALGTVVYYYCGIYVATPALGSAGALMKRISYGLALPGLFVTICIYLHASLFSPPILKSSDRIATSKVHLPAVDEGQSTPYQQLHHTLGCVAQLYGCMCHHRLHHRQVCFSTELQSIADISVPSQSSVDWWVSSERYSEHSYVSWYPLQYGYPRPGSRQLNRS
jgi:hypothetical protein